MIDLDLTDVAHAAVSCAGASPGGAARPEPALAAVCTTATPCPDAYTHETSLMPAHDVFYKSLTSGADAEVGGDGRDAAINRIAEPCAANIGLPAAATGASSPGRTHGPLEANNQSIQAGAGAVGALTKLDNVDETVKNSFFWGEFDQTIAGAAHSLGHAYIEPKQSGADGTLTSSGADGMRTGQGDTIEPVLPVAVSAAAAAPPAAAHAAAIPAVATQPAAAIPPAAAVSPAAVAAVVAAATVSPAAIPPAADVVAAAADAAMRGATNTAIPDTSICDLQEATARDAAPITSAGLSEAGLSGFDPAHPIPISSSAGDGECGDFFFANRNPVPPLGATRPKGSANISPIPISSSARDGEFGNFFFANEPPVPPPRSYTPEGLGKYYTHSCLL